MKSNESKNKDMNPTKKALLVIKSAENVGKKTDPLGSYTGTPEISSQKPVQDADDL